MRLSRSDLESDIANALSRHIGYTTGMYQIDRIASIVSAFKNNPSLYQFELIKYLVDRSTGLQPQFGKEYAAEIINIAVALRLIFKAADGPTSGANRFALTPGGIAIRSALVRSEKSLVKFAIIGLVLESDCDAYGLILDILHEHPVSGPKLHKVFRERFDAIRRERLAWLDSAFPNQALRERIYEKTPWILPGGQIKRLSNNFARHHVTPRLGWARWFGHIHSRWPSSKYDTTPLTTTGFELLRAVRSSAPRYVWLGPSYETQTALGISESNKRNGPWAPSWNLLRPANFSDSQADIKQIADAVAEFMDTHYEDLRLVHANQASIESVLPYLHFIEKELGYSVNKQLILETIFGTRATFHLLSTRLDKYGYFQRKIR